jgi:hypothetical protein
MYSSQQLDSKKNNIICKKLNFLNFINFINTKKRNNNNVCF